jgi:hypothetical protein
MKNSAENAVRSSFEAGTPKYKSEGYRYTAVRSALAVTRLTKCSLDRFTVILRKTLLFLILKKQITAFSVSLLHFSVHDRSLK